MADKMIKVTLTKSTIGATPKQKKVVEALGLKKMHQSVELVVSHFIGCFFILLTVSFALQKLFTLM